MADLLYAINNNDKISMNISLAGNNVFQTGHNTVEYSIDAQAGSAGIEGYQGKGVFNQLRTAAIESMLDLRGVVVLFRPPQSMNSLPPLPPIDGNTYNLYLPSVIRR